MQKQKIERVYIKYTLWEDWINGMWRKLPKQEENEMIERCIVFTGDYKKYGGAMIKVVDAWGNTMINSLTNDSMNQLAFVGHCACQYEFNCPEYITRMAWGKLTDQQRFDANNEAKKAILHWKKKYINMKKDNPIIDENRQKEIELRKKVKLLISKIKQSIKQSSLQAVSLQLEFIKNNNPRLPYNLEKDVVIQCHEIAIAEYLESCQYEKKD